MYFYILIFFIYIILGVQNCLKTVIFHLWIFDYDFPNETPFFHFGIVPLLFKTLNSTHALWIWGLVMEEEMMIVPEGTICASIASTSGK